MDWDDLKYFLATARKGSIRAAAETLGVNHSTVSRRLAGFEDKLGVRLFERMPGGYLTTQAGEDMVRSAERIEDEIAALDRRIAGRDTSLTGLLRVTVPGPWPFMQDIAAFAHANPGIELEVAGTTDIANLTRREADVAVRFSNDPPGHLVGRRLLQYAVAVYASPGYLADHDMQRSPAAVNWIGWNDPVPDPQWVRESAFPKSPARHRLDDLSLQVQAAKAGLGISILPCFIADNEPGLVRVPPGDTLPGRDLWLLTHEDLRYTARVRKFIDFMADAILKRRDLFEGRRPQV